MKYNFAPIALLIVFILLFGLVAPALALTPEEIYVNNRINDLQAANKMSSDEIYSVYVDMTDISNQTVTATIYKTDLEIMYITTHSNIMPQPISGANGAKDKLTKYLDFVGTNYEGIVLSQAPMPDETVLGYVYGQYKEDTLDIFVGTIPDCLNNTLPQPPNIPDSGDSHIATPDTHLLTKKYQTTTFTVDTTNYSTSVLSLTTTVNSPAAPAMVSTVPVINKMDVKPYIKDKRAYIPIRYLAYACGVTAEAVTWNADTGQVGISKGSTLIKLKIGSTTLIVNGKSVKMDVAPEITGNRTMLPARWVAESLGAAVTWDETTKQVTIKIPITEVLKN